MTRQSFIPYFHFHTTFLVKHVYSCFLFFICLPPNLIKAPFTSLFFPHTFFGNAVEQTSSHLLSLSLSLSLKPQVSLSRYVLDRLPQRTIPVKAQSIAFSYISSKRSIFFFNFLFSPTDLRFSPISSVQILLVCSFVQFYSSFSFC